MRAVFTVVLVLHALLHLLGFAKGVGLAPLPQLTLPVSRAAAVGWLAAAALLLAAFARLPTEARHLGLVAVMFGACLVGFLEGRAARWRSISACGRVSPPTPAYG